MTKNKHFFVINPKAGKTDISEKISSDINKIFEPFYMADKSRNKSVDGFGLGLSICKEISNLLDINIEIKSEIDVGTEIILNFKGSLRE